MSDTEERKGWFGSTFNKLKSALSKTKTAIVGDDPEDNAVLENRAESAPEIEAASLNSEKGHSSNIVSEEDVASPQSDSHNKIADTVYNAPTPVETAEEAGSQIEATSPEPEKPSPAQDDEVTVPSAKEEPVNKFEFKPGQSFSNVLKQEAVQASSIKVDEEYLESLEERLIKADIGLNNAESVINNLRQASKGNDWNRDNVVEFLKAEFLSILNKAPSSQLDFEPKKLNIYLVVGVNGTGKTTSIGKLCWRLKQEGKKVLMAAGDTFRAAAESQLEIWSKRAEVDIVRLEDGADPGAVVYKALERAKAEDYDCLVIDTAGRLHNKTNLMAELKKVRGVIDKHGSDCNLESLLVIDASTGQNGLQQAKLFTEVCSLTGVVLTKLDGTAKGGIVLSIAKDLDIPVKLIGLGEHIDDLKDFEPEMFVEALL